MSADSLRDPFEVTWLFNCPLSQEIRSRHYVQVGSIVDRRRFRLSIALAGGAQYVVISHRRLENARP